MRTKSLFSKAELRAAGVPQASKRRRPKQTVSLRDGELRYAKGGAKRFSTSDAAEAWATQRGYTITSIVANGHARAY